MTYVQDCFLDSEVATRNKVNTKANELSKALIDLFASFEGKKVVKSSPHKSLAAQINKRTDEIQKQAAEEDFRFFFRIAHGSISVELDTTYRRGDTGVKYVRQHFFLASYTEDSGLMIKTYNPACLRDDYTVEEIREKRAQIRELETALSELNSSIREFNF